MSTMLIIAIGYRINEYLAQFSTRIGHWVALNHHALTYSFIQSVSLTLERKAKTTTAKNACHMCALNGSFFDVTGNQMSVILS